MSSTITDQIHFFKSHLPHNIQLVAVSKTKPVEAIIEAYQAGQTHFGENKAQELLLKQAQLPPDIKWHFIGHLQTNKVKSILPLVYLIHGIDSIKLLDEVQKQSQKINQKTSVLLQIHIAQEETKFGFDFSELEEVISRQNIYTHVCIRGLMGMASNTPNEHRVRMEFRGLKQLFNQVKPQFQSFDTLSMGMSGDYQIAIEEGSNLIRIGSTIFGTR